MKKILAASLILMSVLLHISPVLADGIIIIDPPPEPPRPDWEPWLTIRYHHVSIDIEDQVAITKVDQVFRNDGANIAEGTYIFPIPPEATVQNFVMWVDGEAIEGEILPAEEAREIYEGYVRRQRDPALLEYVGRDAVRARIYPIPPGEERRIQLEYTQILPAENALMHYRYPLNTEKFSAEPLEQVSVSVNIASSANLRAIYSPSHQNEIEVDRKDQQHAHISYEASNILPERDFELYISTNNEDIDANLMTYQVGNEDGFFLLLVAPTIESDPERVIARDIFLVLDTSGSMDGEKLIQAQEALVYVLKHLNPQDRFNVIAFSSHAQPYAATLQPSTEANKAIDWVYTLEALGGTNIYQALSETLAQADENRKTIAIFLTDGLPTEGVVEEDTLLSLLSQEAPESAHIFPFGVGYDVNTLFLDQLAQEHSGSSAYVEPDERIDENVSAFYAKVQSPLLTNIDIDFGNASIYDVYPSPLPDLYAGTQLIVTGRYNGDSIESITLNGKIEAQSKTYVYEGNFMDKQGKEFIPRLWATRKIGYLLTQIRLHGENEEWIDAVVSLSLRYGIITPYTSFLIEEPSTALSIEGREKAAEEFSAQMAENAVPAIGGSAIEDADMRKDLGEADAAPLPSTSPASETDDGTQETRYLRYVGDRTFLCKNGLCSDTTYIPEQMQPQEIVFMSEEYWTLLNEHPDWGIYFSVSESSIFVAEDGNAYLFRFGSTEDEIMRPEPAGEEPEQHNPNPTETITRPLATETKPVNSTRGTCNGAAFLVVSSCMMLGYRTKKNHHKKTK